MKKLILLASALLLILGSFTSSFGNATTAPVVSNTALDDNGELPPPSFLLVTNVTESKITLGWTNVPGAVQYRITAIDIDNNVFLSSNILTVFAGSVPTYTVENLPAATNIQIGVSATSIIGGDFGEERTVVQQTDNIIIIDIVTFLPCSPSGGNDISFNGDLAEGLTADPSTTTQNGTIVYHENNLHAEKPLGNNKVEWAINLGIVGLFCPNGSMKYVCQTTGTTSNITKVVNQVAGTVQYKYNNANVLRIQNIHKTVDPVAIKFDVVRENATAGNVYKYANTCLDVTLNGNPCTTGTYAQSGTPPPGKGGQMTIHTNEIVDADNTSLADLYYNRDGSVAEQYRTADSRDNIGLNDENIIDLIPTEESLAVSPNPFNDFTNIQYQVTKQSPVSLTLYNAMGQIQKEILNDGNMAPGYYSLPMDVSDLQPGVYFLTIQTQSGRKITTVVKQ